MSANWRSQLRQTMRTMQLIEPVNPRAQKCYDVIQRLCSPFLESHVPDPQQSIGVTPGSVNIEFPIEESPQTQINNMYAMMWPNANPAEADVPMQDSMWTGFFPETDEMAQHAIEGVDSTSNIQFPWD